MGTMGMGVGLVLVLSASRHLAAILYTVQQVVRAKAARAAERPPVDAATERARTAALEALKAHKIAASLELA